MKRSLVMVLAFLLLMSAVGLADAVEWPVHYDEPITLTTVRQEVGGTGVFRGENVDYENNVWADRILERYNIKVKYLWVVDGTQYSTKLNLMLASGDLPDFMALNVTQTTELIEEDLLADVTNLWENPSPWCAVEWAELSPAEINAVTVDGKVMALPGNRGSSYPTMFFRKDWMDKLNLEEPKSFADVIKIATAFAKEDPDGNGQDDTVGLPLGAGIFSNANERAMLNAWHVYPGYFYEVDGKLVYGTVQPEMKNALSDLAGLYADGVIYKEFGTATESQLVADSKQGIVVGQYWTPLTELQNAVTNDPECEWLTLPIMSIDDQPLKINNTIAEGGEYIAINAACEHPEAVMQLMDMYVEHKLKLTSDEDFTRFVNDVDGNEVWQACASPARTGQLMHAYTLQEQIAGILEGTVDPSEMMAEARSVAARAQAYLNGDKSLWCWWEIYRTGGPIYWENKAYLQPKAFVNKVNLGAPTQTELDKGATMMKVLQEGFTAIIKGERGVDDFDAIVEQWLAVGGQDWIDEINAKYGY